MLECVRHVPSPMLHCYLFLQFGTQIFCPNWCSIQEISPCRESFNYLFLLELLLTYLYRTVLHTNKICLCVVLYTVPISVQSHKKIHYSTYISHYSTAWHGMAWHGMAWQTRQDINQERRSKERKKERKANPPLQQQLLYFTYYTVVQLQCTSTVNVLVKERKTDKWNMKYSRWIKVVCIINDFIYSI